MQRGWKGRFAAVGLLLLCGVLVGAQVGFGQEIFGQVVGTVTDATGAVISQATVKITNEATGVSQTDTTSATGEFIFTRVLTGTYTLKIEHPGFKGYVQKGITVSVAKASRVDVKLEVGAITQAVTVTENAKQVETTSIQLSSDLQNQTIVDLPLNGRDWTQLARTLPGVTAAAPDRFGTFSVSGGRSQSNNYLINGIDYNDLPLNTPQAPPSPDSIAEFRIIQNTMNPEYSRNSAATLNAITRSGTSRFHGDGFWFHRDHGLNATDFFTNEAGQKKPPFSQQQYGGVVGGPIYKDHTFFFFSYQGFRNGIPQDLGLFRTFNTAERAGTFTLAALPGTPVTSLSTNPIPFQVNSTACGGTTCPAGTPWNTAFPTSAGVVSIPTSNFNSISQTLLGFYPSVTVPATNSFDAVGTQTNKRAEWSLRIDQNWKKDQVYGYFYWRRSTQQRPFSFTGGDVPGFGDAAKAFNRQTSVTWVHTFNASTINEARVGYNRLRFLATFPQTLEQPSALGFTGITPQHPDVASAPLVEISGFATFGFSNNGPQPRVDATFQYADSFSKIIAGHNIKFGIDNRRGKIINPFDFSNNGHYTFSGAGGFSSGVPAIDFLLGIPDSYIQQSGALNAAKTEEYYSYVQDTWTLKHNLTVVYGLGYQIDTPYRQLDNNGVAMIAFRPGKHSTVYPTAPPGFLYTGDPGVPRGTVGTRYKNFAPRLGAVWSPSAESGPLHWVTGGKGDFSIRAGGGIFYNLTEGEASLQFLGNPPLGVSSIGFGNPSFANPYVSSNSVAVCTGGGQPVGGVCAAGNPINPGSVTNPFPGPAAPPIGSQTFDFTPLLPSTSVSLLDPKLKVPRTYNFNLTIERQLKRDILLRIGYVGGQGRNLYAVSDQNPINSLACATAPAATFFDPVAGATITTTCTAATFRGHAQVFPGITPNRGTLVSRTICTDGTTAPCVAPATLATFVDGAIYGAQGEQTTISTSHYNSLQILAEKRGKNLFLRGTYTLSKSLDDSSGLEDTGNFEAQTPGNPLRDMGFSGFDTRHIAVFTYDYILPLPKPANGVLKHVLEGWAVGGITSFQSGFPVTVSDLSGANSRCLQGRDLLFYDAWCRPNQIAPVQISDPRATANNVFFSRSSFARVATNSGLSGNSPRNPFHGPGVNNWDLVVRKDTHFTESMHLEVRGEFFNAWNHAQFDNPSGSVTSSFFGRVSSDSVRRAGPRVIQIGTKLYF